jgi:hypothetical protein
MFQVTFKPFACQPSDGIEGAGLFEKMRRARNDHELLFAVKPRERLLV